MSEDITNKMLGSLPQYIGVLGDFAECLEDLIFLLKSDGGIVSENNKYDQFVKFFEYCRAFASDNRGIGTIMKQLDLYE